MKTKPSIRKINKGCRALQLSWNLFRFRFSAGRGKAQSAQKFLNRLPLPTLVADQAAFHAEEKKLWRKYVDLEGNLRLLTWGNIFSFLLKTVIGFAVVAVLVWAAYFLNITFMELKAKSFHPFQPDTDTGEELKLINGESIMVDLRHKPEFSDKSLCLPVVILKEGKSNLFYIPAEQFPGELISLSDGSQVREFLTTNGKAVSYLYNLEKMEAKGTWLGKDQLVNLKTAVKSGTLFAVDDGKAVELCSGPQSSVESILKIPGGEQIIFIHFAPLSFISSKFLWVEVRYLHGPGKDYLGWIPAVSIVQPYLEEEPGSNTFKIINPTLSFRQAPSTHAGLTPGMRYLKTEARVEFLKFAPLENILSSKYMMIQVRYTNKSGKVYTGWIAAGQIKEKFIGKIDASKK